MEAILGTVATTVAPKLIEMGTNAVTSAFTGPTENTNMGGCSAGMHAEAADSAISDVHAPPVDVRLAAEPVPMVSQSKPYRSNNTFVEREPVAIKPVRQGLGTNRYDLFDESATRVVKTLLNLSPETYSGYVDSIIGALNLQNTGKPWTAYSAVAFDGIITPAIDGVAQEYKYGAYDIKYLIGKKSLLLDGEYGVEVLVYSESSLMIPLRHFVKYKVEKEKYTEVLLLGPMTATKAISAGDHIYLRFAATGPLQHETSNYLAQGTNDLFDYLNVVEPLAFSQYEAYSVESFRIDMVDAANWLKTDTAILVYYVGDPDRWPVYGMTHNYDDDPSKIEKKLPVLSHEPHLQTVKIFKAGYNLSFELPIPKNRFFTTYDGKTKRLNSPGSLSIVPLLPGGEGGAYKFSITTTATIKYYCPTIRTKEATFSHSVPFPAVWPGEYLLRQDERSLEPYMELPLPTPLDHYRQITPTDGAGFTAVVDGHPCEFVITQLVPSDDKLKVYTPHNLAILGNIYAKPREITITKFSVPKLCHVTEILAN